MKEQVYDKLVGEMSIPGGGSRKHKGVGRKCSQDFCKEALVSEGPVSEGSGSWGDLTRSLGLF